LDLVPADTGHRPPAAHAAPIRPGAPDRKECPMKIRTRILLTVALPLLIILGMASVNIHESRQAYRLARDMRANAQCFQAASDLVAELQRGAGTDGRVPQRQAFATGA
jgi:hypothetical protein